MDPMLLESNNEKSQSNKSDIIITNTSSQSNNHYCSYCSPERNSYLIDNVTKSIISVEKWISQELDRLSHNYLPRNCLNYETLVSIVEGYYQSDVVFYKGSCTHTPTQPTTTTTTTTITKTTMSDEQLTQKNLIIAFTKVIKYCQTDELFQKIYIDRKPLELLIELEKMCQEYKKESNFNSLIYQKSLKDVLFGTNIPISKQLVNSWTMICLWVQQDTSSFKKQEKWCIFGIYSYQLAKKLCGIDHS